MTGNFTAACKYDLNLHAITILGLIKHDVACSATRLSRLIHVSTPAMTGLLDTLQQRGLIVRRSSCSDRRMILLQLTPLGHHVADQIFSDSALCQPS